MTRHTLLMALASALLIGAAFATQLADLRLNYYSGRSGEIVVVGQEATVRDAHAVLLDSGRYFAPVPATTRPSSLQLNSLPRVLAGAMGIDETLNGAAAPEVAQLVHAAQRSTSQVARKPPAQAQVIFNIESVGKTTLDRFHLDALSNPSTPHLTFPLSTPSVTPPAAAISVSTSAATGVPVSVHGVVGDRWRDTKTGAVISAYDTKHAEESFAAVKNLADLVVDHTAGNGLTLSVSASEKLAWSFAAHSKIAKAHPPRQYCIALQDGATLFRAASENSIPALNFNIGDLQQAMTSSATSVLNNLGNKMQAHVADHVVTVSFSPVATSSAVESVRFDLRHKADVMFLAELQYVMDFPAKLKAVAAIEEALNDESQDLIVVSFAGFTALLEQYGRESPQFKAALRMLDALFPVLSSEYASLFAVERPAAMQTLLFLGSHNTVLEKTDPREVQAVMLADHVTNMEFFPNVYVPAGSGRDLAAMCAKLNRDLAAVNYMAYCPTVAEGLRPAAKAASVHTLAEVSSKQAPRGAPAGRRLIDPASDPCSKQNTYNFYYPCMKDVGRYQIILWISIVLACTLLAAVYALAYMPFKKDTLLYSSFNPNWEDRKRR